MGRTVQRSPYGSHKLYLVKRFGFFWTDEIQKIGWVARSSLTFNHGICLSPTKAVKRSKGITIHIGTLEIGLFTWQSGFAWKKNWLMLGFIYADWT